MAIKSLGAVANDTRDDGCVSDIGHFDRRFCIAVQVHAPGKTGMGRCVDRRRGDRDTLSIGKFAIGYYLGKSAFSSVYGIAGSFLVLLLWCYYTAQIFLFGAEFTRHYSLGLGTRVAPGPKVD